VFIVKFSVIVVVYVAISLVNKDEYVISDSLKVLFEIFNRKIERLNVGKKSDIRSPQPSSIDLTPQVYI